MKELELHNLIGNENRVEINVKKQQEIEYLLDGTLKPKPGHFVWEINKITKNIKKAEYKKDTTAYNLFAIVKSEELIINPDCIYIPALNKKNALIKFEQNQNQENYYVKPAPMKLGDLNFS